MPFLKGFRVCSLALTLVNETSNTTSSLKSLELIILTLQTCRNALMHFIIYFSITISIFLSRVCSASTITFSLYSISSCSLILVAMIPALLRLCGLISLIVVNESALLSVFYLNQVDATVYTGSHSQVVFANDTIDGILLLFLISLVSLWLYHGAKLMKIFKFMNHIDSPHLAKWRMAFMMTIYFFLIIVLPIFKLVSVSVIDFLQENSDMMRERTALVQLITFIVPIDAIGLLMCLVYIHCRSVYYAGLDRAKRLPSVIIVSTDAKNSHYEPPKLLAETFKRDAFISISSRPPALNHHLDAGNFLNLSLQSTLGRNDYRGPSSGESESTAIPGLFESHLESFAVFDDLETESLTSAMFERMNEMPRFDSVNFKDLF